MNVQVKGLVDMENGLVSRRTGTSFCSRLVCLLTHTMPKQSAWYLSPLGRVMAIESGAELKLER